MKIGFIVENNWLNNHFGVRNLFISCFKVLEKNGYDVDFIRCENFQNKVLWYRDFISDRACKSLVKSTTIGTKKRYKSLTKKSKKELTTFSQFLGEDIKDQYDCFVITNPWLINCALDLGDKKTILICYDCIANVLSMQGKVKDLKWGFAHNAGYRYALNHNVHFLSISPKTDKEIVEYYAPVNHSSLPSVPTYSFMDIDYPKDIEKENSIILAAPFDERKGLRTIPDILNPLKDDFDVLYIYGTPRCGKKLYNEFYKKLNIKNVVHYNEITSDDLINLYRKSKLLLFPSLEEGLGMPIIEAQLAGCRVVTTNKPPMNELLCQGNYLLQNNDNDIENIRTMLKDDSFDYSELNQRAKEKFSTKAILTTFEKIFKS